VDPFVRGVHLDLARRYEAAARTAQAHTAEVRTREVS
jgi:hypothetical protein